MVRRTVPGTIHGTVPRMDAEQTTSYKLQAFKPTNLQACKLKAAWHESSPNRAREVMPCQFLEAK